jgi:hypothetical protein
MLERAIYMSHVRLAVWGRVEKRVLGAIRGEGRR